MDYATILRHSFVIFVNRVEFLFAINYFGAFICLMLTMHRYVRWLLNYYQPMVNAQHLTRWDMMNTTTPDLDSSTRTIGLNQLASDKGNQWFYKHRNFSFAAHQSVRQYMEDRMCYLHEPQTHNISMFSIFDGHGGSYVSDFLERNFNRRIVRMLEEKERRYSTLFSDQSLMEQALIDEVERIDADVSFSRLARTSYTGSTLISALLHQNRCLTIINIGDSRAVAADLDGKCVPLSIDHKPHLPEERERIEQSGGFVEYYGVERVQGILAVSRAFGDSELKRNRLVISRPEIRRIDLDRQPLRYILLASDGFWDVVKSQEAILEVNYLLDRTSKNTEIAEPSPKKPKPHDPKPSPKEPKLPIDSANKTAPSDDKSKESVAKNRAPSQFLAGKSADLAVFKAIDPLLARRQSEKRAKEETEEKRKNSAKSTKDHSTPRRSHSTKSTQKPATKTTKSRVGQVSSSKPTVEETSIDTETAKGGSLGEIAEALKPGKDQLEVDIASHLVGLALKRRSPDNISVFFVRLDRF